MAGAVARLPQFIEEVMDEGLEPGRGRLALTWGVRRDPGGFCLEAVGWCCLGVHEGLAAIAVGMDADAIGPQPLANSWESPLNPFITTGSVLPASLSTACSLAGLVTALCSPKGLLLPAGIFSSLGSLLSAALLCSTLSGQAPCAARVKCSCPTAEAGEVLSPVLGLLPGFQAGSQALNRWNK